MTITVLDTYPAMREILRAPLDDRPALLKAMLEPAAGMYRYFPGEVDLVAMHQMASGFPLDRDEERCLEALEALHGADAWGRIGRALDHALDEQVAATPGIALSDITVLVVLGDPGDAHFMGPSLGMAASGSVSGHLFLNFWPYPENLARLEATAVHELNHNLRYSPGGVVWDPATVTVGEHVVSGLEVTGMQNFTAWVHGDASAVRFGATPVGLPTGAGYAVGNRLVDAYLAATGGTAAEALHADGRDIIDTALGDRAR